MRSLKVLLGVVIFMASALMVFAQNSAVISQPQAALDEKQVKNIVVLSDRVEQANAKYLIYPQVSEMVAASIINELNLSKAVKAPSLSTVREKLRSPELIRSANKLLSEYRYTYELNYEALRKIAKNFNTQNVLIVTGGLDTVSDFLKPTWWNFLNIPGENVVKTEYRLYTYIALVDLSAETITWQNTYHRQITAPEFALANATYSPDYRQLTKIKKGSDVIAKDAAYRVESVLTPWFAAEKEPPTVHELVKFKIQKKQDEYIQNINERKAKKAEQKELKKEENAVLIKEKQVKFDETIMNNVSGSEKNSAAESNYDIKVSPLNIIIPKM